MLTEVTVLNKPSRQRQQEQDAFENHNYGPR
jgi:hypothetical protein